MKSVLENASATIRAALHGAPTFTQAGFSLSTKLTTFPLKVKKPVIAGTLDGTTSFVLALAKDTFSDIDELVEGALKQQRLLSIAPIDVTPDDLVGIFRRSMSLY